MARGGHGRLDCRKPFSFYFDLVAQCWKAPTPGLSNNLSLHRICTLARKQGANFVTLENALPRPDVREEIDALDAFHGGGGTAQAILIGFFSGPNSPENIATVQPNDLIGSTVLINYRNVRASGFGRSYIYEAIITPPFLLTADGERKNLLNNFVCRDAEFQRTIRERQFTTKGFYYCQQNSETHVCAHASLRMAVNSDGTAAAPLTNVAINKQLNIAPPFNGLTYGQIADVIRAQTRITPIVFDCTQASNKSDILSTLASYVESGCIVLFVFKTGGPVEHVVSVYGHTRNSDEWHPQAIVGYRGAPTAPYFPSSAWVDHFLIHDDNLGPYYTLSSRALEVDPAVSASLIIAIHPHLGTALPHHAEKLASIILTGSLANYSSLGSGVWFEYITRNLWLYVMRAILMTRDQYKDHIRSSVAHDDSRMSSADVALFDALPDSFWMVEFSLPSLFTGNRSKLGEVFIGKDVVGPNSLNYVHGIRLPSLALLEGVGQPRRVGISSHSPFYVYREHDHQW